MNPDTANIFVVRVSDVDVESLRRMRDYVAESMETGFLVLPTDATLETISVPKIFGVAVEPLTDSISMEITCTPLPDPEGSAAEDADEEPPKTTSVAAAEEKQAIMQRLIEYRQANKFGCLSKVAKATRSRGAITEDTLRAIVAGTPPKMELSDWRKIGKALERLEEKDAPPAEDRH